MDTLLLSRLFFAFTAAFHFIFPPLSIGLGLILVIMEGLYLKTLAPVYEEMTRFWVRVFGLLFAMGVATGIVLEFQFGTNWSRYSRYVGDIFGSALAAEGVFAFFLESGFLAILLFGWHKVSRRTHFLSTILVCLGAHFSAIWILVANSWQQTPGELGKAFHIVKDGVYERAEIVDFWAVVFNPSTLDRLSHTVLAAWLSAAFMVMSVSAYYVLRNRHLEFARASMRIGIVVALVAALGQLVTGHESAEGVGRNQPAKLAAMEAHYPAYAAAPLYLFGWVDVQEERVTGVAIPGLLSYLIHADATAPVTGLSAFKPEDRPPVQIVFQAYHLMVGLGLCLIAVGVVAALMAWRGTLFAARWFLWILVFAVLAPQLANQFGWITAEVGRQPWIVYGLLRTRDAYSEVVGPGDLLFSLALFALVYGLLFVLFVFLLDRKIKHGPIAEDSTVEGRQRA